MQNHKTHPETDGATPASFRERLFVAMQYLLPHHLLSGIAYRLVRARWEPLKRLLITQAIRHFGIDMGLAKEPEINHYESFNAFFTRALRPDARPIDGATQTVISPVDGTVSQLGQISEGRILQAKGHSYALAELLGGDEEWTQRFAGGTFINIYLSPRDYHRIHSPRQGVLRKTVHVPGRLFSVNPATTRAVPGLFARNERLCSLFDSDIGPMAVVMVGAIFVSSIETVWGGEHTSSGKIETSLFPPPTVAVALQKGEELGRFNMGSTVILLFEKGRVCWSPRLATGSTLLMGEAIGKVSDAH